MCNLQPCCGFFFPLLWLHRLVVKREVKAVLWNLLRFAFPSTRRASARLLKCCENAHTPPWAPAWNFTRMYRFCVGAKYGSCTSCWRRTDTRWEQEVEGRDGEGEVGTHTGLVGTRDVTERRVMGWIVLSCSTLLQGWKANSRPRGENRRAEMKWG